MIDKKKKYSESKLIALDTWVKLARAFTTVDKKATDNIRSYNLTTAQFGVLEALGHLGSMTIGTLCEKMLSSGGNMTLVLDNLEKLNLIERIRDDYDRRAIKIRLTPEGKNIFEKIFLQHAEYVENLFSILSKDEQILMGGLLKKLGLGIKSKE